jgi:transposase
METSYTTYSPHEMQNILQEYKPGVRGCGFKALSKKYNVIGGHTVILKWKKKWDGTEASLKKQSGGDARSILTPREKKVHIHDFATKKSKVEAVEYPEVKENVEKKTKKAISLRSVQKIGQSLRLSSKKRKRVLRSQGQISLYFRIFAFSATYSENLLFLCDREGRIPGIRSKH